MLDRAQRDAEALASGGVSGIIVENFGDAPFHKVRVGAHTVSAMTLAVEAVKKVTDLPMGVNVLRNDARAALAIACVTGASFIRVNVHTGAMVTDEGVIVGRADETLRYRRMLGADVKIFADAMVKHAVPIGEQSLWYAAKATRERGLADALIVSGVITGEPTPVQDIETVKEAVTDTPVLVGSGVDDTNVRELLSVADGAIVGTSMKQDGKTASPVDPARVATLVESARDAARWS